MKSTGGLLAHVSHFEGPRESEAKAKVRRKGTGDPQNTEGK